MQHDDELSDVGDDALSDWARLFYNPDENEFLVAEISAESPKSFTGDRKRIRSQETTIDVEDARASKTAATNESTTHSKVIDHLFLSNSIPQQVSTVEQSRQHPSTRALVLQALPTLFAAALTSGNIGRLQRLISDYFEPDCEFITTAVGTTLRGREHILQYHLSVMAACPDAIRHCPKSGLLENEVRSEIFFHATHMFDSPSDFLFDVIRAQKCSIEVLEAVKRIKEKGHRWTVYGEGIQSFHFNEAYKFCRVVFDHRVTKVEEFILTDMD